MTDITSTVRNPKAALSLLAAAVLNFTGSLVMYTYEIISRLMAGSLTSNFKVYPKCYAALYELLLRRDSCNKIADSAIDEVFGFFNIISLPSLGSTGLEVS